MVRGFFRIFKGNWTRFAVIVGLTFVSTIIVSAVGSLGPHVQKSIDAIDLGTTSLDMADIEFAKYLVDAFNNLSYVFPTLFIVITALVVYMTVSRLVECERAQIGCLKTLGYSRFYIVMKYVIFTAIGCVLGCLLGVLVGQFGLSPLLFSAVLTRIAIPNVAAVFPTFGVVASVVMIVFVVAVTFATAFAVAKQQPAALFRGKAPANGGKIIFEKIPLWDKWKYKYKSTFRNLFRYKTRFFMTVFSMLVSTALVFAGISLFFSLEQTNMGLLDAVKPISAVIVVAAVAINTMVLYNITNINIEERKREIATLMVLGYRNFEVLGYIFREILVLTIIGVAIGLPAGYGVMAGIFELLKFGGVQYIDWYVWIITAVLSFVSLGLANLLLFRKILKTDMNGSLKTVE